jgi:hypothetical protein
MYVISLHTRTKWTQQRTSMQQRALALLVGSVLKMGLEHARLLTVVRGPADDITEKAEDPE